MLIFQEDVVLKMEVISTHLQLIGYCEILLQNDCNHLHLKMFLLI